MVTGEALGGCSLPIYPGYSLPYHPAQTPHRFTIDIRVEGLETDSINTASRADSSMLLVLRPLHSSMKLRVADQELLAQFSF